jgi:hypothetical protein
MADQVTLGGNNYNIGKIPTLKQLHVARRLAPFLAALVGSFKESGDLTGSGSFEDKLLSIAAGPVAEVFSKMTDEDVDYIINECLSACKREQSGWHAVMKNGVLMYQDIQLDTLMALTFAVIQENLGSFFPTSQPKSTSAA